MEEPERGIESLQDDLNLAKEWCEDRGLDNNPDKVSTIIFSRKYKLDDIREISFGGRRLLYLNEVKYLGIYLDKQLYVYGIEYT